ncbi:MAG: transcription termination/antitermination protein NusA, partial [Phycisphaerae bacterium]|nr:transcription termination/antitermination protein NusA [Phycisphaerae bacterium]
MNQELLRVVDSVARDKNINKETVFEDLEAAMLSAIRKANPHTEDIVVRIDRELGEITATVDGEDMSVRALGRIAAQTAKQVMIQKIREAERDSIYEEYLQRKGQIVTGRVARWEGGSLVIDLGRTEAFLPKSEQIPGESHLPEERIRAMVLDVREQPSQVRIILSRTHPDFIRTLFELEVPEVAEGIIELRILAREAGYRTKVAVNSNDDKVDAVGACVGVRGSRIRNIVDELGGEKIDIVRWSDSSQALIANGLKPAEVSEIAICFELGRATVVVNEDQLSLAIGKHGQNVRLAARLTGWDIDILTPSEYNREVERLGECIQGVEGIDDTFVDNLLALGIISVLDLEEVGKEPLVTELGLEEELAGKIIIAAGEMAKQIAAEKSRKQAESVMQKEQEKQKKAEKPDVPEIPEIPEVPEEQKEADVPDVSEIAEVPEEQKKAEVPEVPEVP